MLSIAVVIATVGLYRNSGAVVIAAMLIARTDPGLKELMVALAAGIAGA